MAKFNPLGAVIGGLAATNPVAGMVMQAVAHSSGAPVHPAAVPAVIEAIAESEHVAIVKTKPMSKSVEGWSAVVGAGAVISQAIGPLLGLQVDGQVVGAAGVVAEAIGLSPAYGTVAVYAVAGIAFVVIWVRKKWFSHTITPAAADRGQALGKVV